MTLSIFDVFELTTTEEDAEQLLVALRWPDGLRCAFCNGDDVYRGKHPTQPYHCRDCESHYSVKSNSVMSDSNLSYRKWVMANYLVNTDPKGVSAKQLQHKLKVAYMTAWHLEHRLREAMTDDGNFSLFYGPVEVDETFIGGRSRNQPKERRKRLKMIPVIGMIDRATNKLRLKAITSRNSSEMQGFVYENTSLSAEVHTDEASGYRNMFRRHFSINHKAGEYGPTNRIESAWAQIKRAYKGTYHKMSPHHLHRYLAEFSFKHDHRGEGDMEKMRATVVGGIGKKLRFVELLGRRARNTRMRRGRPKRLDWVIESSEGDIIEADLTRTEAVSTGRKLAETRSEPISVQNIHTGEELVYLPDGSVEHYKSKE